MGFFTGDKPKNIQRSTLGKDQLPLKQQLLAAAQRPGAGGAFGQTADYYRDLLSNDSQTFNQMAAPEMRRFNEQIIPGLSEQFAGMGAGNLSSSGFRNAAVNAGTDLSERLGAIRANLRQQGAQGLMGIGQQGLQNYYENITQPGNPGFLDQAAPLIGSAAGTLFGPAGTAIGGAFGQMASNWLSNRGQSSPYGNKATGSASAAINTGIFNR